MTITDLAPPKSIAADLIDKAKVYLELRHVNQMQQLKTHLLSTQMQYIVKSDAFANIPIITPGEVGVDAAKPGEDHSAITVRIEPRVFVTEAIWKDTPPEKGFMVKKVAARLAAKYEELVNDWVVQANRQGEVIKPEEPGIATDRLDIRAKVRHPLWYWNGFGEDPVRIPYKDAVFFSGPIQLPPDHEHFEFRNEYMNLPPPLYPEPPIKPIGDAGPGNQFKYVGATVVTNRHMHDDMLFAISTAMMANMHRMIDDVFMPSPFLEHLRRQEPARTPERIFAEERGEKLLRDVLGEQDYVTFQGQGYIDIPSKCDPNKRYRIRRGRRIGIVKRLPRGDWQEIPLSLCIHPKDSWKYVSGDLVASHALLAKFDEGKLNAVANEHHAPAVGAW